jgi:GTPase SAR1 family protein
MGSSRERGFSVTPERLAFIEQKMREMGIESRGALAEATTLSPDVIHKKLFSRRNVDRSTVEAIAKTLKIQPTEIIEPERWYQRSKTAKSQASTNIDWHYVCRTMLDRQKKLSTNEVIASEPMQFDLLDDEIFISLALVERKEAERLSQNVHPARPIEQYEEKPPIEYEQFREQILRQGKSDRIAIVGEPGAGKTTLLQHIAFWILDKELGLPIWISLGDLIKNGDLQRLKDYLTQVWLDDAVLNVTQDVKFDFLKQLNEQRVWLLLDGADEIVASSGIALREINNQLRGWLSQSCIILTCRINVWEVDINALRDFQTYRTKEFHYPTQVEQFIESGFRKSNQQSGERLKTELANTERTRLQQLVRNPLRLMMLCTTWHEQESLPATKAELYKRFVSEFYKWNRSKWKKKDLNYAFFPNTVAKQEKLNKALGRLACRALDEESSPFRLPHNLVADELGDPDEDGSNFWLALNLGWLQVARDSDPPQEKVYTFFHPTFQEYFAACACALDDWHFFLNHNNENPNPFLKYNNKDCEYRVFERQWKEVILIWLGRADILPEQKDNFIYALLNFKDGVYPFYWFQAFFLSAASIAEFQDFKDGNLIDAIVSSIVDLGFGYFDSNTHGWFMPNSHISEKARAVLQESNRSTVIKKLTQLLVDNTNILNELVTLDQDDKISTPVVLGYDGALLDFVIVVALSLLKFQPADSYAVKTLSHIKDTFYSMDMTIHGLMSMAEDFKQLINISKSYLPSSQQASQLSEGSSDSTYNPSVEEILNGRIEIDAVNDLLKEVSKNQEPSKSIEALLKLRRIIPGKSSKLVVEGLKKFLQDLVPNQQNWLIRGYCIEIMHCCAQNMYYPDFYQAWHQTTVH